MLELDINNPNYDPKKVFTKFIKRWQVWMPFDMSFDLLTSSIKLYADTETALKILQSWKLIGWVKPHGGVNGFAWWNLTPEGIKIANKIKQRRKRGKVQS